MSEQMRTSMGGGRWAVLAVAGLGLAVALVLWALMREKPAQAPQAAVEIPAKTVETLRPPPPVLESVPEEEIDWSEVADDDMEEPDEDWADVEAEDAEEEGAVEDEAEWIEDVPIFEDQTPFEPGDFIAAVRAAIATNMDPVEVSELLARVPPDPELVEELKALAGDPAAGAAMQGYAAEALVRAGTPEAMQYVLGELLAAYQAGNDALGDRMVAALEAPTSPEGLQSIFDLLLKQESYADLAGDLPDEVLAAARKALLDYPDKELVGDMAANLYLDPAMMANEKAMWELFDGISHPIMLSRLVARAYEENLPDNATKIMERLGQSDEQGVVQAVVQLALNPAVPVDAAADALYDWSLAHPEDAMPGLFLEYMTDATLTPEQRTIAAYGLAGTSDPEYARQALEKALKHETDPAVLMDLQTALSLLETKTP